MLVEVVTGCARFSGRKDRITLISYYRPYSVITFVTLRLIYASPRDYAILDISITTIEQSAGIHVVLVGCHANKTIISVSYNTGIFSISYTNKMCSSLITL